MVRRQGAPRRKSNRVLNGHHNEFGEVFKRLVDLKPEDLIEVYSKGLEFHYQAANKLILLGRDVEISVRLENARWISPSQDERLTLITCWPYFSNNYRLINVASPIPGG